MTTVLCTLYNSLYLDKGLVLYDSLCECAKDFKLYVLCMDDKCYEVLTDLKQENHIPIKLSDFELGDEELLKAKGNRSFGEYCWTCTPSIIKYIIEKYKEPICTYIDADMYFYNDPQILIDGMLNAGKSVMIVPHRFTKINRHFERNGIYCVEFNTFLNTPNSLHVLRKWRSDCLECCTSVNDGVHFGDQKYLDEWPSRYACVHVSSHKGAGVAPWNIQSYRLHNYCDNNITLKNCKDGSTFNLIFYHFQHITYIKDNVVDIDVYNDKLYVQKKMVNLLYQSYLKKTKQMAVDLEKQYCLKVQLYKHSIINKSELPSFYERVKKLSICKIAKKIIFSFNKRFDVMVVPS